MITKYTLLRHDIVDVVLSAVAFVILIIFAVSYYEDSVKESGYYKTRGEVYKITEFDDIIKRKSTFHLKGDRRVTRVTCFYRYIVDDRVYEGQYGFDKENELWSWEKGARRVKDLSRNPARVDVYYSPLERSISYAGKKRSPAYAIFILPILPLVYGAFAVRRILKARSLF